VAPKECTRTTHQRSAAVGSYYKADKFLKQARALTLTHWLVQCRAAPATAAGLIRRTMQTFEVPGSVAGEPRPSRPRQFAGAKARAAGNLLQQTCRVHRVHQRGRPPLLHAGAKAAPERT
jgi:hypothetical protein